ncbi:hypothetical protein SprV_0401598300 [Sparganum proliferum]
MFFLRIAEALIANQEANRIPDYTELEQSPASVLTPPPFSDHMDLNGGGEAPHYRKNLPLITTKVRKRADSIDGHILRSLVSLRPEVSPKSPLSVSPVDQHTRPMPPQPPPPPQPLLSLTVGRQSSHSPSVSPENSNTSCNTSGSSPSNARLGGGLLYSLLVSSDSRNPDTPTATASPSPPSGLIRSRSFVSASAPETEVCEFTHIPASSRFPQWPLPQTSPHAAAAATAAADEHLLHHLEEGGYPNPVKKYRATKTYPARSTHLLDTRHSIFPICRSSGSGSSSSVAVQPPTGLRRFTFSGYSTPRSEHISALLQHRRCAAQGSMAVPNPIKPPGVDVTSRDDVERSALGSLGQSSSSLAESSPAATSCSTKIPSAPTSVSTPSILFALISSPCVEWSPGVSSASTDSGLDEPLDLTGSALSYKFRPNLPTIIHSSLNTSSPAKTAQQQASTLVQLAKKTARPVQARVTEWLRLALEFVLSSVSSLTVINGVESWLPLFRATWHCLLVISMAEHALEVVVVERTNHNVGDSAHPPPWGEKILRRLLLSDRELVPEAADQAFADAVIQCLSDLRSEQLMPEEFTLLRRATLMAAGQPSVLPAIALKLIRNARSPSSTLSADPMQVGEQKEVICDRSGDTGPQAVLPEGSLTNLKRGLVGLAALSPQKMASLFCTHLSGEPSIRSILPPALFNQLSHLVSPCPVQEVAIMPSEPTLWPREEQSHHRGPSDWTGTVRFGGEIRNGSGRCKRDSILNSLIQNSPIPSSKLLTTAVSVHHPKSNA